eukprot:1407684-Rhodomonas_salina.1
MRLSGTEAAHGATCLRAACGCPVLRQCMMLPAYALHTRCPVLRQRMVLPGLPARSDTRT